jgi:hypothetical protein
VSTKVGAIQTALETEVAVPVDQAFQKLPNDGIFFIFSANLSGFFLYKKLTFSVRWFLKHP